MSKVFVRLKSEYGKSFVLTSPSIYFSIKEGGAYDPSGFEIDREFYERYLMKYVDVVPRSLKKKRKERRKSKIKEKLNDTSRL